MILTMNAAGGSYDIVIERGVLAEAGRLWELKREGRKALIVTDSGVPTEYAELVAAQCSESVIFSFPTGEESKNFDTLKDICAAMLESNMNRHDCVIAVGGGVVGDMAGFAASCYMRGIDFYNIPTTLLSQVDSSVGGKTAIDFMGVKNIIGAFYQPKGVLIDPDVLKTLDDRQLACGMAEIIKMAVTLDAELFERLEAAEDIYGTLDIESLIAAALRIKINVVENDEREADLRRVLNFGHTLGHGIESNTDFLHGEAVALGMLPMASEALRQRLTAVLRKAGLPTELDVSARTAEAVIETAMHDKKAEKKTVTAVRADEAGAFRFESCTKEALKRLYEEVF